MYLFVYLFIHLFSYLFTHLSLFLFIFIFTNKKKNYKSIYRGIKKWKEGPQDIAGLPMYDNQLLIQFEHLCWKIFCVEI